METTQKGNNMKKSFSLIELLIGLIVVSLLLAAFTPLITKKLKVSETTVGSFGTATGSSLPTVDTCEAGYHLYQKECYPDIPYCKTYEYGSVCSECKEGYSLEGALCAADCTCENGSCSAGTAYCTSCNEGYILYNNQCIMISEPNSREDCDKIAANLMYVDKIYNGSGGKNLCVTKYNVGDENIPVAESVTVVQAGTTCNDSANHNCCWRGTTALNCDVTGNDGSTYNACTRTNCQWKAGNDSCLNWTISGQKGLFRLPSIAELKGWGNYLDILTFGKGSNGLQLCDRDSSTKTMRCDNSTYCYGGKSNGCYTKEIWSKDAQSTGVYYQVQLINNVLETSSYYGGNYAHSVRCVFDGTIYN